MALATLEPKGRALAYEQKRADLVLEALEADGTFSGYASLFNKPDLGRDVIEPGAFARSLATRKAGGIRMLFQHDPNQPIGTWEEIREDARGLFVRGRLATGAARAREVLSLLRAGALDGLSIGFRTVRARADRLAGVRRILEADLWEISVVTFPMMPEARVGRVKSAQRSPGALTVLAMRLRRATETLNQKGFFLHANRHALA